MSVSESKIFGKHGMPNIKEWELEQFVKKGTVISIKHPMVFEPVLNVVQAVDGMNIYFRITDAFLKNNVLKGDRLSCQVLDGEYEYVLDGMISEIAVSYPKLVQFCVDRIRKFKNYRKTKRYLVDFQAIVSQSGTDGKIYSIVKNVSLTGISAIFKEDIDVDSLVTLNISVSIRKNEFLNFKAKVIRVDKREMYNEYGLEIVEIDEMGKDILDRLIFQLEDDESKFVADCLK